MKEYKGRWWLPSKIGHKVSGILYYTPGKEFRLELIGSFDTENDNALAVILSARREEIIHGQTSDGTYITLFDSGCRILHVGKAEFATTEYKARKIAIGMLLMGTDEKRFFKAIVKIPELSYWLYPATLQQYCMDTPNGHGIYVKMEDQAKEEREVAKTEVREGVSICLCRRAEFQSGDLSFKPTFEQYTSLQVESTTSMSALDLYITAVRFERFLSLATLREVGFSDLLLFSEDYTYRITEEVVGHHPVAFDTVFHNTPSDKIINKHEFLFDYKQIAEEYPQVIKKWYAQDELFDDIRGHFLETIDYHGRFSYINFLVAAQAVEGYGHRYLTDSIRAYRKKLPSNSKTQQLQVILNVIWDFFKNVEAVNQSCDLESIVATRDYHSHLFPICDEKIAKDIKLYELTDDLRIVLLCCVMSYLGFTNERINALIKDSFNYLFRR